MSKGYLQNSPLQETAKQLCDFLPGIDRLIFIGGSGSYSRWTACEWLKKGSSYSKTGLEITEEISAELLKLRRQKPGYNWTDQNSIPFYVEQQKHTIDPHPDIFKETGYLTLVIRLNTGGNVSDLLYLFFRDDKSNFGISHDTMPIDTSQKSIIGMLITNFANIIYDNVSSHIETVSSIKKEFLDLLRFHSVYQEKGKNSDLLNWKIDWAREVLSEMSERDGVNYVYREDALNLLVQNEYPYKILKNALEDAVRVASMFAKDGEEVFIERYFIKFTDINLAGVAGMKQSDDELPAQMDKVYQFLDKLETAAQKLLHDKIQPTSSLIGKAMEEPITAPAIRDALKKNQKRVVRLLNKYPERWKYIRTHFRPVQNILPKNNYLRDSYAG